MVSKSMLNLFSRGIERTAQFFGKRSKQAVQDTQTVPKLIPLDSFTDPVTGITTTTKEYATKTIHGDDFFHLIKTESWLEDGARKIRTQVFGRWPDAAYDFNYSSIDRTKTIARTPKGIMGGDTVEISKKYTETMSMPGKTETLKKEYNALGEVEHKDLSLNVSNGYKVSATQDRVPGGRPLTSAAKDMYEYPSSHPNYMHTLRKNGLTESNHASFSAKSSYAKAVEAKEQASIDAVKKAEEEAAAAKLAAEKAAAELKATQPRLNVGKILGIDINELKMVEKTRQNGEVVRYYFKPGQNKPCIKTIDKGLKHEERFYGSSKADLIVMTQVGEHEPYIMAKKGNFVQLKGTRARYRETPDGIKVEKDSYGSPWRDNLSGQYYYDGLHSMRYNPNGIAMNGVRAEIKIPYQHHPDYINGSDATRKIWDNSFNHSYSSSKLAIEDVDQCGNRVCHDGYATNFDRTSRFPHLFQDAKSNWIDLDDLLKSYKA